MAETTPFWRDVTSKTLATVAGGIILAILAALWVWFQGSWPAMWKGIVAAFVFVGSELASPTPGPTWLFLLLVAALAVLVILWRRATDKAELAELAVVEANLAKHRAEFELHKVEMEAEADRQQPLIKKAAAPVADVELKKTAPPKLEQLELAVIQALAAADGDARTVHQLARTLGVSRLRRDFRLRKTLPCRRSRFGRRASPSDGAC